MLIGAALLIGVLRKVFIVRLSLMTRPSTVRSSTLSPPLLVLLLSVLLMTVSPNQDRGLVLHGGAVAVVPAGGGVVVAPALHVWGNVMIPLRCLRYAARSQRCGSLADRQIPDYDR